MSDDEILERGGTQEDINRYAHDVGGACGAAYGDTCEDCVPNQASEDELRDELYDLAFLTGADSETGERTLAFIASELAEYVQDLIRTEKLKLLAEVMEEALSGGLSFELDDGRIVIEVETDLKSITTKLEAEL